MNDIDLLFAKAVDPDMVRTSSSSRSYTSPHTWGVYEINEVSCGPSGTRFRKGNHPIRRNELEREFGRVILVALFTEEAIAIELASRLNDS